MTSVYRRFGRIVAGRHAGVVAGTLLGLAAVAEALTWPAGTPANPQFLLLLCLVCLGTTLPLALPYPTVAAAVIGAAGVLSLVAFGMLTVAGLVAELIAGYRLGRRGVRSVAVLLGLPYLAVALAGPADPRVRVPSMLAAALVPAAGLAGTIRRARADALANLGAQQEIAGTLLAHAARGERARIARELHDVVAHHISMIAVQAETARLTTAGLPPTGAQRLSAIADTARSALTEMRRLLGVLREDARAEPADRRPQPGLRQLNELLDAARDASGTGARLILSGSPVALDPGVELAAYRIVQESLTNARRHAPGAAVDVALHYTDDALLLTIRDNGPGPPAALPVPGHGLLGMRERAAAVGGEFRTGLAAGGGFLVEATLPAKTGAGPVNEVLPTAGPGAARIP
jgi:signal transduction histidine kinase